MIAPGSSTGTKKVFADGKKCHWYTRWWWIPADDNCAGEGFCGQNAVFSVEAQMKVAKNL